MLEKNFIAYIVVFLVEPKLFPELHQAFVK